MSWLMSVVTGVQVATRINEGPAVVNVLAMAEPSTIITGLVTGLTYEFKVYFL